MSQSPDAFLVVNGWTIFAHPLFLDQIEVLLKQVEVFRQKDPTGYVRKNASKRLAANTKLAFEIIPQDPGRVEYRQGNALGEEHKHWFRAKFFQQYRYSLIALFGIYRTARKVTNRNKMGVNIALNPIIIDFV